jgi:RND family efflux transporter MFP subunit
VARVEPIGRSLTIGGTACSATQTLISPEVELLADLPPTPGVFGLAAPTRIIELVPEGAPVLEDDLICRLDPTAYVERARLQRIQVDRARSSLAEAERGLAVAEAELIAFRDGDRVAEERRLEVDRAVAIVDHARAGDYLDWSARMGSLGYVSSADLAQDRLSLLRAEVAHDRAEVALETFRRSTVEKRLRDLEARVEQARTQLAFAEEELDASEDRLEHLDEQVSRCEIRAPHDGSVFYTDVNWREYYRVREGAEVYPGFPLFYLPDLSNMEVELLVHERFARLVAEGQRATVSFEAIPGRSYPARVKTVDLLPTPDWYHFGEWQQVRVRVALDEVPGVLRPEMTARVEITTDEPRDALTVPTEAVAWDESGAYCVVPSPSGPTRRPVVVDRGTVDRLVARSGLEPGDSVLLRPRTR